MNYIQLDKSDFDKANWQEVISICTKKESSVYSREFMSKAKEAKSKSNSKNEALFELLGVITYPILTVNKEMSELTEEAYNLIDNYIEVLKELVSDTSDAEMRARISDVIWMRQKDYKNAIIAVNSYIESSRKLLDPNKWSSSYVRILRAIDIAASIGKNTDQFNNVIKHIESVIDDYNGDDAGFLSLDLMYLLQEYKKDDIERYALLSEKIAKKAEDERNWKKASDAWTIKARWHSLAGDKDKQKESLKNMAETYVKHAEGRINNNTPDYLIACHFIETAIQEYRKIGNEKKRIDELHQLLLEYQPKTLQQMTKHQIKVTVTDAETDKIKEIVRGKTLQDAILALASIICSPKISKVREDVEVIGAEYPITGILQGKILNEKGKQIHKQESMVSEDADNIEKAIKDEMFSHAKLYHLYYIASIIEPARQQIIQEHTEIQINDLLPIVSSNPFVPEGRELIYANGLYAGLVGDFLISTHLLIPQIENSIRFILSKNGLITSGLDQDGIQNEYDLNNTLTNKKFTEKLNEIMTEDIVFDLRGLLVERCGSNLRNRMAHGLIDYSEYDSSLEVKYLWWLTLNLCYLWKVVSMQSIEVNRNAD